MNDSKKGFVHNVRQSVLTTLVLLLICGFLFPVVLTGLSAVMFPHQAGGSLLTTADGTAVGAQNVGQDFTQPYFMKGRPSAYQYNTYYEDEEGNQFYNDGTEFAGLSSGSNNYGPSNPALAERVQADIEEFLAANPGVRARGYPHRLAHSLRLRLGPAHLPGLCRNPDPRDCRGLRPQRGGAARHCCGAYQRQGAGRVR